MLEAEVSFIDELTPLLDLVEGSAKHAISKCKDSKDWELLWRDKQDELKAAGLTSSPWGRMTYTDAVEELNRASQTSKVSFEHPVKWGDELRSEHEKWLVENVSKGPLFVTDYPEDVKSFYMLWNPVDERTSRRTVASFDLLVPRVLELAGGSLRMHRFDELKESLQRKGFLKNSQDIGESKYAWYLDLRKYGSAPHGGFGLGLDRLVSWICGTESVRDCVPMPRWPGKMLC
jgi:asparaginyl-tRNA synthetase